MCHILDASTIRFVLDELDGGVSLPELSREMEVGYTWLRSWLVLYDDLPIRRILELQRKLAPVCVVCGKTFFRFPQKSLTMIVCNECSLKAPFCACGCGERTVGLVYRRKFFGGDRGKFGFEYIRYVVGHGCRGKKFGEEAREHMSVGQLRRRERGGIAIKRMKEKIRTSTILRWRNPTEAMGKQRSKNLSKSLRAAYASGRMEPPVHTSPGMYEEGWLRTKKGGRLYYRSSWEKTFLKLADVDSFIVKAVKAPFRIKYRFKGKLHTYFPDFLVTLRTGTEILVEIKGYHQGEKHWLAKKKAAEEFCSKKGLPFKVFRKEVKTEDLWELRKCA